MYRAIAILVCLSATLGAQQPDPELQKLLEEQDAKIRQMEATTGELRAVSQKIKDKVKGEYTRLGAFKDASNRDLRTLLYTGPNNTIENCAALAKAKALPYFGVQYGVECRGDTRYGTYGPSTVTDFMPCSGNAQQSCGAGWVNEVYAFGAAPPPPPPDAKIDTAAELTAALAAGGDVKCEGAITGNFTISKPTQLVGTVRVPGVRAAPDDPTPCVLTPADVASPVLSIPTAAASGSSVVGVRLNGGNTDSTTLLVGTLSATDASQQPSNITIRGNVLVAGASGGLRGISAHGTNIVIEDNYVGNYWNASRDTQAVWGNNGPGPYRIVNNYLEASGENIMFGGDAARIPNVVPADILVKGNLLFKPQEWRTASPNPSVKNLFELKNAQRVVVEDNVMDGNWRDSQEGSAILFTVRNEGGRMPWATVTDVTFRRNLVLNTPDAFAVNILGLDDNGLPSVQTKRIVIEHNLFRDSPNGVRVNRGVTEELAIANNTFPKITGNLIYFTQLPKTTLRFERNVTKSGAYGINGEGQATNKALAFYAVVTSFVGNVVESQTYLVWPTGTTVVPAGQLAGLLDANFKYTPGGAGY